MANVLFPTAINAPDPKIAFFEIDIFVCKARIYFSNAGEK